MPFCKFLAFGLFAIVFTAQYGRAQQHENGAGGAQGAATQNSAGTVTQQSSTSPKKTLQSNPIGAVATVKDNIIVSAGLLTPPSATQLFGGWIAEHFLVVQLTISNQSRDQQFILHDIFLDYSDWKLSGIYGVSASPSGPSTKKVLGDDRQSATTRGHISSIGALEMQDSLKQNSVFSKRNFFVNGLVLIGSTAGGFTFLGPTGFTQGVAGYSSSFIPALQKFWPDRRIDQQSNVLKYGFQDKMVIAKEDPGKTYAFFPIERLLAKGLSDVYRSNSAYFLNMAELYLNPEAIRFGRVSKLKSAVDGLMIDEISAITGAKAITCPKKTKDTADLLVCVGTLDLNARVLADLFSPCYEGQQLGANPAIEPTCSFKHQPGTSDDPKLLEIRVVKDTISGLSLNTVKAVVTGIMTVDVAQIPSVLTKISFDDSATGRRPIWEDVTSVHTGQIDGKYLLNGQPKVSAIKIPSDPTATVATYIDTASLTVDSDKSTDSELHFSVKFLTAIPDGSIITFQVVRTSGKPVNDPGNANTQETTTSMSLDYTVAYLPSTTTPAAVAPVSAPTLSAPATTAVPHPTY